MTKTEVALLLTLAASFDQRTIGETDAEAWFLAVGDLDYEASRQAVIQYYSANADKRVMPAHIRLIVHPPETPIPPRWPMTSAGLHGVTRDAG